MPNAKNLLHLAPMRLLSPPLTRMRSVASSASHCIASAVMVAGLGSEAAASGPRSELNEADCRRSMWSRVLRIVLMLLSMCPSSVFGARCSGGPNGCPASSRARTIRAWTIRVRVKVRIARSCSVEKQTKRKYKVVSSLLCRVFGQICKSIQQVRHTMHTRCTSPFRARRYCSFWRAGDEARRRKGDRKTYQRRQP